MADLVDLVDAARGPYGVAVEEAIFGAASPAEVASALDNFVTRVAGAIDDALFYRLGVGVVVGLRLADGAEVVVKVQRWNVSIDRLEAVHRVQQHLADSGLPAPRPLLGPTALGNGIAVIEEHRPGGSADVRLPEVRRSIARGLHQFIAAASALGPLSAVGEPSVSRPLGAALWEEPHDLRFDFDATAPGAEWIDDLARVARRRLVTILPPVIGHVDWRVENLGFDGPDITAIYDWDSVCQAPEPAIVGFAAASFSADWRIGAKTRSCRWLPSSPTTNVQETCPSTTTSSTSSTRPTWSPAPTAPDASTRTAHPLPPWPSKRKTAGSVSSNAEASENFSSC